MIQAPPPPASIRCHTYVVCLGVPQVEWKINEIKYTKPGEHTKHFE